MSTLECRGIKKYFLILLLGTHCYVLQCNGNIMNGNLEMFVKLILLLPITDHWVLRWYNISVMRIIIWRTTDRETMLVWSYSAATNTLCPHRRHFAILEAANVWVRLHAAQWVCKKFAQSFGIVYLYLESSQIVKLNGRLRQNYTNYRIYRIYQCIIFQVIISSQSSLQV